MNILRPNKRVQSALISSTSYFTDVYEEKDFAIHHASSVMDDARGKATCSSNPVCRNSFVMSFLTEPRKEFDRPVYGPYSELAREVTSYMAVLFGKRFDCHGLCQSEGLLFLPLIEPYQQVINHRLQHNTHKPRRDIRIPLKLSEVRRISPLFEEMKYYDENRDILRIASRFYMNGLEQFETQPETAYLLFVTVGEILARTCHLNREDLLDEDALRVLTYLRETEAPKWTIGIVRSKLRQVKRKYVVTLLRLIRASFFIEDEDSDKWFRLSPDDLEDRLNASYDLRSKWVHMGMNFKGALTNADRGWEVLPGDPKLCETEYQKLACRAPKLEAMERLMRYAILSRMQEIGLDIDDSLCGTMETNSMSSEEK